MLGSIPAGVTKILFIMFEYGQLVKLKNGLIVGKRYDNLVYTEHHAKFFGKLLNIYKVSSSGTYYCAEGDIKHSVTFSQAMLEVPKFNIGDIVAIISNHKIIQPTGLVEKTKKAGEVGKIECICLKHNSFYYILVDSTSIYPEDALFKMEPVDITLKNFISNENQLQEKDAHISRREGVSRSGVHGRLCKASVQSRRIRDPKAIKGS